MSAEPHMSPGEWIALVGLAMTVILASVGSWRASLKRDATTDAEIKQLRKELDQHRTECAHRDEVVWARFDEEKDRRHELRTKVQQLYGETKEELAELRGRQR